MVYSEPVKAKAVPRCPFCFGPVDRDGCCIERPQLRCRDVRLKVEKDKTLLVWLMIASLILAICAMVALTIYLKG
jgi:hypothetical protein